MNIKELAKLRERAMEKLGAKKRLNFLFVLLGAVIVIVAAVSIAAPHFYLKVRQLLETPEKQVVRTQAEELDFLRQQRNLEPFSEEALAGQAKELDKLSREANFKPLSDKEKEQQAKELDELRLESQ